MHGSIPSHEYEGSNGFRVSFTALLLVPNLLFYRRSALFFSPRNINPLPPRRISGIILAGICQVAEGAYRLAHKLTPIFQGRLVACLVKCTARPMSGIASDSSSGSTSIQPFLTVLLDTEHVSGSSHDTPFCRCLHAPEVAAMKIRNHCKLLSVIVGK